VTEPADAEQRSPAGTARAAGVLRLGEDGHEEGASVRKLATGIRGFDHVAMGGLPARRATVVAGQAGQQPPFGLQVVGQRGVQGRPSGLGQRDDDGPPVGLAAPAGDQPLLLQPVQPLGDRARGDQRGPHQRGRGQLVGGTGPAQRSQHVEGRDVEAVPGEGGALGEEDLPLQLGDAPDDAHRTAVQVGPLAGPLGQDLVDGVPHAGTSTVR